MYSNWIVSKHSVTHYSRTCDDKTGRTCHAAPNQVAECVGLDLKSIARVNGLF
jgi:hypothetical protein